MLNYEEYLQLHDCLSFEKALSIYRQIFDAADLSDADFTMLWGEVISYASEYVQCRNYWAILNKAEKLSKDAARTQKHNVFMSSLEVLVRYMEKMNWDTSWKDALYEDGHISRKTLGDFAGYLLLFGALSNR